MASDRIVRVPDHLVDGVQEWVRETDDDLMRGVGALQRTVDGPWSWQVSVWVAEFLREEPLESELRRGVMRAIQSVPGVTEAAEEDREVWIVSGTPSGEELVRSVAAVVDELAPRAHTYVGRLPTDEVG